MLGSEEARSIVNLIAIIFARSSILADLQNTSRK